MGLFEVSAFELLTYCISFAILMFLLLCMVVFLWASPYPQVIHHEEEKFYYDPATGEKLPFSSWQDPATVQLSVIVPSYNEQERLPIMLDECIEMLESRQKVDRNYRYEVIVVDDGSRDHTSQVAQSYTEKYGSDKVRVLTLLQNRGKGGAVRLGMQCARGRLLLFADADGATKFSDLAKLEDCMDKIMSGIRNDAKDAESKLAIVCGSRAHLEKESIATRSYFRTLLMWGFHFLVWVFGVREIKDTQCGFKLLTREAGRLCFTSLHIERWAFDVELLSIAQYLNIPLAEVAVNWKEVGGSKVTPVWSWIQMGKDLFLIWLRYKMGAWKLVEKIE